MKWLFLIILSSFISTGSTNTNKQTIVIKPNESAQEILSSLHSSGLIRSVALAKVYLKLSGQVSNLKPGVYYLESKQKFGEIIKTLSSGPDDVRVTIPEGWRREQIAEYLKKYLSDDLFLQSTVSLEGKLFPDTYFIPPVITSAQIIKLMTDNFYKSIGTSVSSDALIIASLIEREAREDGERGIIAGILWKRYKNSWALQVDATLQYAQGRPSNWWPKNINTKLPSAYNTYSHLGLPPSPIGNPGLASIMAALKPVESPYWYYLHDNKGVVHFAKTLEEHNLNIDKYLNH